MVLSETVTQWRQTACTWCRASFYKLFPCFPRKCRVAPSILKSSDTDYVLVQPGVSLRVKHTLAVCVDESGADETDAAAIRDQWSPAATGDFWFNHWQGPHITCDRQPSYSGPGIRRHSLNRFGPADGLQSQRRLFMISGPSGGASSPRSPHHLTPPLAPDLATEIVSELIENVLDSISGPVPVGIKDEKDEGDDSLNDDSIFGTEPTRNKSREDIDDRYSQLTKRTIMTSHGVVNPAYEPADEVDGVVTWSESGSVPGSIPVADVTTESTCTDCGDCGGGEGDGSDGGNSPVGFISVGGNSGGVGGGDRGSSGEVLGVGGGSGNIGRCGSSTTLHSLADQKPLLFFIHGVGDSMDVWTQQVNFFSKQGYECLTLDLIGHGFSSAPPRGRGSNCLYRFGSVLDQVRSVYYRYAAYYRHVVLIGHAYGSALATALCRELPNITLLVLVSCGGPTRLVAPGVSCRQLLPVCLLVCLRPLLMCGFKSRELFFCQRGKSFRTVSSNTTPSHVVDAFSKGQVWAEGDLLFHRHIQIPTLLLYGLRDQHVSLVDMCEMEKAIPRAFLETISSAGHVPHQETAAETNHLINQFLTRWRHLLQ